MTEHIKEKDMTEHIKEIDAKQGRKGFQVALIVIISMILLGFTGWIAMFTAS